MNTVKAQTRHAWHSDEAAAAALPQVHALARHFGPPSLFVTWSLDYSCLRPLLLVTLGRLNNGSVDAEFEVRTHALARAPGEAAKVYLKAFDAFLECVAPCRGRQAPVAVHVCQVCNSRSCLCGHQVLGGLGRPPTQALQAAGCVRHRGCRCVRH